MLRATAVSLNNANLPLSHKEPEREETGAMRSRPSQVQDGTHRVRRRRTLATGVLAVAVTITTFGASAGTASTTPLRLRSIVEADRPIGFALHPNRSFFVVEQTGKIRELADSTLGPTILDVSKEISDGNEQGLLGAVFSNDGSWLYVNVTNRKGDTEIRAYPFRGRRTDPTAVVKVLEVAQPFENHNGGGLVMDGEGVLWIGLGDGGSAGDPGNRAQDLDGLLGKILRIVPTPELGPSKYEIPPGNLEKSRGRPEIWAYGLRNPWRFSIDAPTKTVWIGDVGQGEVEEINAVALTAAVPNFGWKLREGRSAYDGGKRPADNVDPVFDYQHSSGGCSVTGGVVARSAALPTLRGAYLFGDYCDGKIRALRRSVASSRVTASSTGLTLKSVSSFGTDADGNVFVASTNGSVKQIVRR